VQLVAVSRQGRGRRGCGGNGLGLRGQLRGLPGGDRKLSQICLDLSNLCLLPEYATLQRQWLLVSVAIVTDKYIYAPRTGEGAAAADVDGGGTAGMDEPDEAGQRTKTGTGMSTRTLQGNAGLSRGFLSSY